MKHSLLAQAANFGGPFRPPTEAYTQASDVSSPFNVLTQMEKIISTGIGLLTFLASLLFILFFIMGSLDWISAAGEKGKIQKARDKMTQSAIGLAIVIISYAAIGLVGTLFGLDILNPATALYTITGGIRNP